MTYISVWSLFGLCTSCNNACKLMCLELFIVVCGAAVVDL